MGSNSLREGMSYLKVLFRDPDQSVLAVASEEKLLKTGREEGSEGIFSCHLLESYSCPGLFISAEAALQWKAHGSFMTFEIPALHFLKISEEWMLRFWEEY